ncbi:MAG: hypothetical protein EZS28_007324 [Streblomastix strix]|uniref:Uncharacterized protein n=1 Tax=Streblomastix strix TaxID=222440 RepID=A0A5J4WQG8_9EUKA|nr:MAG: hypothetical protein EZS28_007324 [Streblomastix strix]
MFVQNYLFLNSISLSYILYCYSYSSLNQYIYNECNFQSEGERLFDDEDEEDEEEDEEEDQDVIEEEQVNYEYDYYVDYDEYDVFVIDDVQYDSSDEFRTDEQEQEYEEVLDINDEEYYDNYDDQQVINEECE